MTRKTTIYLILGCTLCFTACIKPADLRFTGEHVLVLNSLLIAGSDSTAIQLSHTRYKSGDYAPWPVITGADVTLYEEGIPVAKALETEGVYHFAFPIKSKYTYKVTAEHPRYGIAWGETTVPSPLSDVVITDSAGFTVNRWRDTPDEKNVYWISYLEGKDTYYPPEKEGESGGYRPDYDSLRVASSIYTTSTLVDQFNMVFDHSAFIKTSYDWFVRIDDSGLSGRELELAYLTTPKLPFIFSVDKHYDAYLKVSIIKPDIERAYSDLPLFYEPPSSYSNIRGGVGLVGSLSRYQTDL